MRVAVVGGGVGGLVTALALRARGHEPIVLEREATPGGKVRTDEVQGAGGTWRIEAGPVAVLDSAPATRELMSRLALTPTFASEAARHRFVLRRGALREVPDSPPKLLFSGTITLREKWRLAREPFAARAPGGDETVADFARRRLGASLAESFAEPMVSGVFAGDWERLSLASAFPRLAEMEREHGSLLRALVALERRRRAEGRGPTRLLAVAGGMGALPRALAAALGQQLRTNAPVTALSRAGGRFQLATPGGPLEVDRIVLAAPADEAARLCAPLDAALADAYASIPVAGIACVSLGYEDTQLAQPLVGFGFLAPRKEGVRILGVQWLSSTFPDQSLAPPGHTLLRCIFGGAHDPAAVALADEELVALARAEVERTMGLRAAPVFTHVIKWPRAIPQYEVGHAERVRVIEERGAALGLYATGAALRGVGLNDVVREAEVVAARAAS